MLPSRAPLLLLLTISAAPWGAVDEDPVLPGTFWEKSFVRRVEWPVRFHPLESGGCDDLRVDQIEVLEDGLVIAPEDIIAADDSQSRGLRTIHALVIDASLSMRMRLDLVRQAALDYIRSLPAEEEVLLASFSDNLILHSPPTRDRNRLETALEEVEVRTATAFNDALHYMIRYLEARPERKIVVVLTDGCDSASLPVHPFHEVASLVERAPNLTLYPIGIDLRSTCGSALAVNPTMASGPIDLLESLARRSGGRFFRAREAATTGQIFEEIRERLMEEGFVVYRPPPYGTGPKDRPERTERRRRVRIRSAATRHRCRVVSAGPDFRTELREPGEDQGLAGDPSLEPLFGERLQFDDWWMEPETRAPSFLLLEQGEIRGHAADIRQERAWLYAPVPYWERGKLLARRDARAEFHRREFELPVPPFELMRQRMTRPEALMLHLLENDRAPFSPPSATDDAHERSERRLSPGWIHGQTLLELRDLFGQGLFGYPGYRDFAKVKLREAYRMEVRRKLVDVARDLPAEQQRKLDALIARLEPQPRPEQLQRHLAEWLGDIPAHDLVVDFERWVANLTIESGLDDPAIRRVLELVDLRWGELKNWFPPPTHVRIITPLVPSFDPERDAVGFYRIVLPTVTSPGPPDDAIPEEPLGLHVVRSLLETEPVLPEWRLAEIDYLDRGDKTRRRMVRQANRSGLIDGDLDARDLRAVRLNFARNGTGTEAEFRLLFEPGAARRPVCADLEEATLPTGFQGLGPPCRESPSPR